MLYKDIDIIEEAKKLGFMRGLLILVTSFVVMKLWKGLRVDFGPLMTRMFDRHN